jgi:hypothetical protein
MQISACDRRVVSSFFKLIIGERGFNYKKLVRNFTSFPVFILKDMSRLPSISGEDQSVEASHFGVLLSSSNMF